MDMSRKPRTAEQELTSIVRTGDVLEGWQRDCLGKSLQLRVPLRDLHEFRRYAVIFRMLANKMDVAGMDKTKDSFTVMHELHGYFRMAQHQLNSKPRSERQ